MVRGVMPNNSVPDLGFAISASSGRKLALPVQPHFLIYSHFKNVSGVPAPEGSSGVTISRLNILDVLIEQMNKIKTSSGIATVPARGSAGSQTGRLDAINESYRNQFRQAKAASEIMPYSPAPQAPAGALLRIKA